MNIVKKTFQITDFFQRMCSYNEALLEMKHNLLQYQHFIKQAHCNTSRKYEYFLFQADIIIFPEDGLTGFEFVNPDYFKPFVQYIPDLDQDIIWNPCLNPSITSNFRIIKIKKRQNTTVQF